jgi:F-type H+-transporting ATPase subunit gamma
VAGAGVKAINKRIRSVKSTQKITKAMKMVSAAKLQRSQGRMLAARPYSHKLTDLLGQLAEAGAGTDTSHPLFEERKVARRLFIVVTSDKGLCGAYNMNIIKLAHKAIDASIADGAETEIYAIGKKVRDYFKRREYTLFAENVTFGGEVSAAEAREVGDSAVDAFLGKTFDEVRLVFAQFVSTMRQTPADKQLLPIAAEAEEAADAEAGVSGNGVARDYIWEPGQMALYRLLLPLYLKNRVFMTLSEAFTSEHAARMTSMTAATENAGELIDALTIKRNRERQAAITSELSDIVGGANAL